MSGPAVHPYGPGPDQFLELTVPAGEGRLPVAVVLHGGFWRAAYGVELARPLAADLAAAVLAAVAVEYRRDGVRCNTVLPSIIDTPANRAAQPDADHSRWVPPAEIAQVIRFLASDESSPTSGAAIPVYGRA